jgi:hypothetical protein
MAGKLEFRMAPPQKVYAAYKEIRESSLIANKTVTETNIVEFQQSLNNAQPSNENDYKSRSLIQYLYRKNPSNFYQFLVKSKLIHLILWTESKCIIRHFGLNGVVYVKWNHDNNEYECVVHKYLNANIAEDTDEHPSVRKTFKELNPDFSNYNTSYQERTNHPREYSNNRGRGDRYQRSSRGNIHDYNNDNRYSNNRGRGGRYQQRSRNNSYQNKHQEHTKNQFPKNNEDNFPALSEQDHSHNTEITEINKPDIQTNIEPSKSDLVHDKPIDTDKPDKPDKPDKSIDTDKPDKSISQLSYSKILQTECNK